MDEDLGTLKAELGVHRRLIQAIHVTQQEHTATLREHSDQLRELREETRELRAGQERILVGVEAIRDVLGRNLANDS